MKNFELLLNSVNTVKVKVDFNNYKAHITVANEKFDSKALRSVLSKVGFLMKYKKVNLKVYIWLGHLTFADKITLMLMNLLVKYIYENTNFQLFLMYELNEGAFFNATFGHMPIGMSIYSNGYVDKTEFLKQMNNPRSIGNRSLYLDDGIPSYTRILLSRDSINEITISSSIMVEITNFLKQHFDDEIYLSAVPEVISELVDNVRNHTNSECIIDINITEATRRNSDEKFKCINIGLISFSENRLFDSLAENIKMKKYSIDDPVYERIYRAYENHEKYFDEDYNEEQFFFISTFQRGVSTRDVGSEVGGTGLTTLVEQIHGKSDDNYSYMMSGKHCFFFNEEYLKIDCNGNIGFNDTGDFVNDMPEKDLFVKSYIDFPGTLYHLTFLQRRKV